MRAVRSRVAAEKASRWTKPVCRAAQGIGVVLFLMGTSLAGSDAGAVRGAAILMVCGVAVFLLGGVVLRLRK